jgi:hypothetical protein
MYKAQKKINVLKKYYIKIIILYEGIKMTFYRENYGTS